MFKKRKSKKVALNKLIIFKRDGLPHSRSSEAGQSLIEIIVALAIGALLIGAASFALVFVLRSSIANQGLRSATAFAGDYMHKVRIVSESDWHSIYNLAKGSSTSYMMSASGTEIFILPGFEGVIDNDVEDNLTLRLKFDEDPNTLGGLVFDFSNNKNNGNFINNPLRSSSSCYLGNCISFDGIDDGVLVPSPVVSIPTSSITVLAWVKTLNHTDFYDYTNNNWGSLPGTWNLYSNASGELLFGITDGSLLQVNARGCATAFTTSTWHFIAGTYDGTNIKTYLDGVQCSTTASLPLQALYTAGSLRIGEAGSPLATNHFIDDVKVYKRAFSSGEISQIFKSLPISRKFFVDNVCRTNDGSALITNTYPCVGLLEDPSTQKVTVVSYWITNGKPYENRLVEYITRWKNRIFHQTDWSGGGGIDGPLNSPNSTFSSSSNIEEGSEPGSLKIRGI